MSADLSVTDLPKGDSRSDCDSQKDEANGERKQPNEAEALEGGATRLSHDVHSGEHSISADGLPARASFVRSSHSSLGSAGTHAHASASHSSAESPHSNAPSSSHSTKTMSDAGRSLSIDSQTAGTREGVSTGMPPRSHTQTRESGAFAFTAAEADYAPPDRTSQRSVSFSRSSHSSADDAFKDKIHSPQRAGEGWDPVGHSTSSAFSRTQSSLRQRTGMQASTSTGETDNASPHVLEGEEALVVRTDGTLEHSGRQSPSCSSPSTLRERECTGTGSSVGESVDRMKNKRLGDVAIIYASQPPTPSSHGHTDTPGAQRPPLYTTTTARQPGSRPFAFTPFMSSPYVSTQSLNWIEYVEIFRIRKVLLLGGVVRDRPLGKALGLQVLGDDPKSCPDLSEERECTGQCRVFAMARSVTARLTDELVARFPLCYGDLRTLLEKAIGVPENRISISTMRIDHSIGSRYWHIEFIVYPDHTEPSGSFVGSPSFFLQEVLNSLEEALGKPTSDLAQKVATCLPSEEPKTLLATYKAADETEISAGRSTCLLFPGLAPKGCSCAVTEWSEWSICDKTCPDLKAHRRRQIESADPFVDPARDCPALEEDRPCEGTASVFTITLPPGISLGSEQQRESRFKYCVKGVIRTMVEVLKVTVKDHVQERGWNGDLQQWTFSVAVSPEKMTLGAAQNILKDELSKKESALHRAFTKCVDLREFVNAHDTTPVFVIQDSPAVDNKCQGA